MACDCISCDEDLPYNDCLKSKRSCSHHCNHSWTHDECCWCNTTFGENYEKENSKKMAHQK